jgi:PKD repeat protein
MKNTFLLLSLFLTAYCHAQTNFCGADKLREMQINSNPQYIQKEDIQNQKLYDYITSNNDLSTKTSGTIYTVPIVFHIIHQNGPENVDDSVIINSVNELNLRFQNASPYTDSTGNPVNIQFCLASVDPWGNPTTGITRDTSYLTNLASNSSFQFDVLMKNVNRWCPSTYLNVWVVYSANGIAYATYPGSPDIIDGIVVPFNALAGFIMSHEAGHYFGLIHTFLGGGSCTNFNCLIDGDKVCDTPPDFTLDNFFCSGNSCSTEMDDTSGFNPFINDQDELPNYMDNTSCPLSFTQGQATRMEASLTQLRPTLLLSNGCGSNPGGAIPIASFNIDSSYCVDGGTIVFRSTSTNALYTAWDFENDGRIDDIGDSVSHVFVNFGVYNVKMIVTGFGGSDSLVKTFQVNVNPYPTFPITPFYSGISIDPVSNNRAACKGTTITLNGEFGMNSYLWSNGATTQSITFTIDSTTTIYLTVVDGTGRTISNCEPFVITVNPRMLLNITTNNDTSNCQELVILRLLPNPYWQNANNTWYDNGNWLSANQFVLANYYPPGSHSIWVANNIDPIGCVTQSDTVVLNVNPPPPLIISQQGNTLTLPYKCIFTTWFKDGVPLNVNDSVLTVTANGCYSASCASCGYFDSDTICITNVSVMENEFSNNIKIYPNPFTEQTTISFNQEQVNTTIIISDALGKEIKRARLTGKQFSLNKDGMKSGIYFVKIQNEDGEYINKKIVLQ